MPNAPTPCNRFGHGLVGDTEPSGDRRVAQPKLLKVKCLRRDLLVYRSGPCIENGRLNRDIRTGSNFLRARQPFNLFS
jgi:hypothetical protein